MTLTADFVFAGVSALYRKPTESEMLPLIAAVGAIGAVDKIASAAISEFKHLTSTGQASSISDPKAPGSFAAVLASLGAGR